MTDEEILTTEEQNTEPEPTPTPTPTSPPSFNAVLKAALRESFPDIPFSAEFHNEKYAEYFTVTNPYSNGADFADDGAQAEVQQIYLHWFMPETKNYLSGKRQICALCGHYGFTYPRVQVLNDSETHTRHVVFDIYNYETL